MELNRPRGGKAKAILRYFTEFMLMKGMRLMWPSCKSEKLTGLKLERLNVWKYFEDHHRDRTNRKEPS